MNVILFRPFDFTKWCAIGLSAFLAGLLMGGNGLASSFNYRQNFSQPTRFNVETHNIDIHGAVEKVVSSFSAITAGVLIAIFVSVFIFIVIFSLLLLWLGARGQFMLLDNIVRNRGAVTWPWQAYARQANSFFLVYLVFLLISFAVIIPILAVVVIMCIPLYQQDRWPTSGEIGGFVGLGFVYFLASVVLSVFYFLFREWGIPIMFRRGLLARAALGELIRLMARHPGGVALFILMRIVLFIGLAIISLILCCATCCCFYQIPYVGTLLLLPAIIYIRCFTLDFLAQLDPACDVFTVDLPQAPPVGGFIAPGNEPPLSPPPPPV